MEYKIPESFLWDIVMVFLTGIEEHLILEDGVRKQGIISRRILRENNPEYFPYEVDWKVLINMRERFVDIAKNSSNQGLIRLANAISKLYKD